MKIFADTHDNHFEFELLDANGQSYLAAGGNKIKIYFKKKEDDRYVLIRDNCTYNISIVKNEQDFTVSVNGSQFHINVIDEHRKKMQEVLSARSVSHTDKMVKAQIPGLISKVLVEKGSDVKNGQPLLILEAMKMENVIKAPCDGRIEDVLVHTGETARQDQLLLKIKPL